MNAQREAAREELFEKCINKLDAFRERERERKREREREKERERERE